MGMLLENNKYSVKGNIMEEQGNIFILLAVVAIFLFVLTRKK
jgi:hypothetical protein